MSQRRAECGRRAHPGSAWHVKITDWSSITPGNGTTHAGKFSVGYAELHRYVRRPGIESDYHMLEPMEYHADTTQLIQMLKKGHHNVKLDDEAWDRLITWIDLNCPYHGTWGEELDDPGRQRERRRELLKLYGGIDVDPEAVPETDGQPIEPVLPEPLPSSESRKGRLSRLAIRCRRGTTPPSFRGPTDHADGRTR